MYVEDTRLHAIHTTGIQDEKMLLKINPISKHPGTLRKKCRCLRCAQRLQTPHLDTSTGSSDRGIEASARTSSNSHEHPEPYARSRALRAAYPQPRTRGRRPQSATCYAASTRGRPRVANRAQLCSPACRTASCRGPNPAAASRGRSRRNTAPGAPAPRRARAAWCPGR